MTVIPTHLYQKLIKQDSDYDERLKQQKNEILNWHLPPELRARMYQDVVRNLTERRLKEEAKPLLVKSLQDEKVETANGATHTPMKENDQNGPKNKLSKKKKRMSALKVAINSFVQKKRVRRKMEDKQKDAKLAAMTEHNVFRMPSSGSDEENPKAKRAGKPKPKTETFSPPKLRDRAQMAKEKQERAQKAKQKQSGKGGKKNNSRPVWLEFK